MWIATGNIAVLVLWAAAFFPLLPWLGRGWRTGDGPSQALVALAALAWLVRQLDLPAIRARLAAPPHLHPLAVGLALGAPLLGACTPHRSLVALLLVVGGYGLAGLYLSPARWRSLRPLLLLAVATLPVLLMVDVILGWPLRKAIAAVAASLLGGIGTETVIRVEGGMAHVDAPCAGFRGLWSFTVLFAGLTAVRARPLDLRWGVALAVGFAVLLAGNVGRVVAIVGIAHRLGWPLLAESVHAPLGAVGLLLGLAAASAIPATPVKSISWAPRPAPGLLVAVGLALGIAVLRPAPDALPEALAAPAVPAGWTPMAPTAAERTFAAENGAGLTKARETASGASIVLVESRTWLAHHVPEQCLRAAGWAVSSDRPAMVDGHPVRIEIVTRDGVEATAVWWFRSGDETTDDLVVRIREGWRTGRSWTLVSLLIPGVRDPADPALISLISSIRSAS